VFCRVPPETVFAVEMAVVQQYPVIYHFSYRTLFVIPQDQSVVVLRRPSNTVDLTDRDLHL
jgi:hypothetical protein